MMLTKKKQRRYLHRKNKEWQTRLQAFDTSRDAENLHQLRVNLKKVKAVRLLADNFYQRVHE